MAFIIIVSRLIVKLGIFLIIVVSISIIVVVVWTIICVILSIVLIVIFSFVLLQVFSLRFILRILCFFLRYLGYMFSITIQHFIMFFLSFLFF